MKQTITDPATVTSVRMVLRVVVFCAFSLTWACAPDHKTESHGLGASASMNHTVDGCDDGIIRISKSIRNSGFQVFASNNIDGTRAYLLVPMTDRAYPIHSLSVENHFITLEQLANKLVPMIDYSVFVGRLDSVDARGTSTCVLLPEEVSRLRSLVALSDTTR